jgi:hypothetical protein
VHPRTRAPPCKVTAGLCNDCNTASQPPSLLLILIHSSVVSCFRLPCTSQLWCALSCPRLEPGIICLGPVLHEITLDFVTTLPPCRSQYPAPCLGCTGRGTLDLRPWMLWAFPALTHTASAKSQLAAPPARSGSRHPSLLGALLASIDPCRRGTYHKSKQAAEACRLASRSTLFLRAI